MGEFEVWRARTERELEKFLRAELDLIETMLTLSEREGSSPHGMDARDNARRALEIISRFAPRLRDGALAARIATLSAHYRRVLEGGEF